VVTAVLAVAAVTVGATSICLAIARPLLAGRHLVDVPNHRSSHTQPTVRGGGVGIVAGLLAGLACCAVLLSGSPALVPGVTAVGATVTILAVVGFVEDVRGLHVGARLISQAIVLVLAGAALTLVAEAPVALALLAALVGVFYVNAANFMDGVNGLSALHGAVAGSYFAIVGVATGEPGLVLGATAVAAAFLSFLPWNARRARMFMGDVGSYALGGAVWALAVWALVAGVPWLTVVAPLLVYATDVSLTLVRRALRNASLTEAHHDHVYQRVQELTGSHATAATLVTAGTIACAGIGLWNWYFPRLAIWALAAALTVLALYVMTPWLLERRPTVPALAEGALR
jgi:UDP-N-acetylmuramyl pentapeptide phosphotransferase/UDP-N-acetylglucosamine-1-phosphate transferase